jgi:putative aldouronate transport system substrate-binding protein
MNADIATGKIADIFVVNGNQLNKLVKSGLIYDDLTKVFEDYASEDTRKITRGFDNPAFKKANFGGKLKAIPWTADDYDSAEIMYVRKDWLDKFGLKEPTTIDELETVLDAFVYKDPDGNGKNDTIGLVGNKDLFKTFASFAGIFYAYNAYPDIWVDDIKNPGEITYGYFAPEMKAPLRKLAEWYKKGLVSKEFSVKDSQKAASSILSGKAGVWFGTMSSPIWPFSVTVKNNFNADWIALPVPTAVSGTKAKTTINSLAERFYVVSKKCKNPEALMVMVNNFVDKLWGNDNEFLKYHEVHGYALAQAWAEAKNVKAYLAVENAVDNNDISQLNSEQKYYYNFVKAYIDNGKKITDQNNVNNWIYYRIFYTGGSQCVINNYIKSGNYVLSKWNSLETQTMIMKQQSIDSSMKEIVTKIIMGKAPIEDYDKNMDMLKKLGADDIIKEVNKK